MYTIKIFDDGTIEKTVVDPRANRGKCLNAFVDDYTVIDLETTGLSPSCSEIIELGAARVEGGEVVATYQQLVRPNYLIDPFITNLTGITNKMVVNMPKIYDVLPEYLDFIGSSVVLGHNVTFDINFILDFSHQISRTLPNDFIDTMRISRKLFRDYENHKLATLVKNMNVDVGTAHRALADCIATSSVYEYMKKYAAERGLDSTALTARSGRRN